MEYLVGFLIALAVGITGVGAGSLTAPVLILFLGRAPVESVGTALVFSAVIKLVLLPLYLARKQVSWRILALLTAGGLPGVLGGSYFLGELRGAQQQPVVLLLVGITILGMAIYGLYRSLQPVLAGAVRNDRLKWLPLIGLGIGSEVGFSSAGAGALGSAALLSLTTLTPALIVGTDSVFGLILSTVGGSINLAAGRFAGELLTKLIVGGIAGSLVGAHLSAVLPPKTMRFALLSWLTFIGGQLCWRALS